MRKVIFLIICIIIVSCKKNDTGIADPITIDEAKSLITGWIYNVYNPEMNPSLTFSLVEYTTDEIQNKLNGQVYSIACNVPGLSGKWVFVRNNKVYDLHSLPGQYSARPDSSNLYVTDLNTDLKYELTYTAHSGSGMIYQAINCFYFINDTLSQIKSKIICRLPVGYQIHLEKEGYSKLYIRYKDDKYDLVIGEVILTEGENGMILDTELNDDIPQEITDNLNGD